MMSNGPLTGYAILVVEDDTDALELYATALEKLGASVRRASTVNLAFVILNAWSPDVVLCDLHLPGLDGYSFVERVRKNDQLVDMPLIAISGSHPDIERERALRAGFTQHLTKPAKLSEIVAAIDAAMHVA